MDMYGVKSPSLAQKSIILLAEAALILTSYFVLFGPLFTRIRAFGSIPDHTRNLTLFAFNLVVFARFMLTLFVFVQRAIPWGEAASVPFAFAMYLVGFPLLARPSSTKFGGIELVGIVLFAVGCFVNTYSEYRRRSFKLRAENRGRLYTGGLFALSMHPNYLGDLLWVSGYAVVSRNPWAALIPASLLCFFYFYNIPKLDAYLRAHYGAAFEEYERRTKRLVPFIL